MLMAESEEELITFLMKEKEDNEKAGLKLNIKRKKTKSWQKKKKRTKSWHSVLSPRGK